MNNLSQIALIISQQSTASPDLQQTLIPRVGLFCAEEPSTPTPGIYHPVFCIVVAGRKRIVFGDEVREYDAGSTFLVPIDLPVVGTILDASAESPYLAICIELHLPTIAEIDFHLRDAERKAEQQGSGMLVAKASDELLDACLRLAQLLEKPQDITVMAPLLEKEILYRIASGSFGSALRDIARGDSHLSQISRAAAWLQKNFTSEFHASELAKVASMSISSLNRHFRVLTGMSPLEYQKQLRLQEARRLLISHSSDVTGIGYAVGYNSPSQFNREYRRLYGEPPGRDADKLRSAD